MNKISEFNVRTYNYNFDYISNELKTLTENYKCREYGYLVEGSGIFRNNNKLAKYISDEIRDNFNNIKVGEKIELNYTYEQLSEICIFERFFDILFVNIIKYEDSIEDFSGDGNYKTSSMWDPINKRFGLIEITINLPFDAFKEYSSCADLVEHELKHAYDDYHRYLVGKSMYVDIKNKNTFISKHKFIDNDKEVIKRYLNKNECGAYVAQLEGDLNGKKFKTSAECIKWLDKHSDAWNAYKELRFYIDNSNNRKLYVLFCKSWNKFINHVSFVIRDHIEDNHQIMERCSKDNWELKYYIYRQNKRNEKS